MADALKSAPVPQWEVKSTAKSIFKHALLRAVEGKKTGDGCPGTPWGTVQLGAFAAGLGAALGTLSWLGPAPRPDLAG